MILSIGVGILSAPEYAIAQERIFSHDPTL